MISVEEVMKKKSKHFYKEKKYKGLKKGNGPSVTPDRIKRNLRRERSCWWPLEESFVY